MAKHKLKSIGIRKLKDSLSSVLREASQGTTFLITDRDQVVAQISQPALIALQGSEGALLGEWIADRVVTLPQKKMTYQPSAVRLKEVTSQSLLDQTRGE